MITALQDTVQSEVETELRDSSHTNVLLVQQLLTTAEQWHLTLTANVAELEDRYIQQNARILYKVGVGIRHIQNISNDI